MVVSEIYKTAFEVKLFELGLCFHRGELITPTCYTLNRKHTGTFAVQLIESEPIDRVIHKSNNGNKIQAIGYFKFRLIHELNEPAFFILGFLNTTNQRTEFVIIPREELESRLVKKNRKPPTSRRVSIVFWLMDDRFLYNCTGIGVEWEWYYLSCGVNGRMIDGSEWDYSEFLNDWDRLTMK